MRREREVKRFSPRKLDESLFPPLLLLILSLLHFLAAKSEEILSPVWETGIHVGGEKKIPPPFPPIK